MFKKNFLKAVSILTITAVLFCVSACSNNRITATDLLIREGVQIVDKINAHTSEAYLRAVNCHGAIVSLVKNLSVKGNIRQAYLCMDGAALLQSLTEYSYLFTDTPDTWKNHFVSGIPSLLAGKIWGVNTVEAIAVTSASDVVSLDGKIDKPAILLLEYDGVCVFVSFIPAANGLTAVSATAVLHSSEFFDLLDTDNTSFFTVVSAKDIDGILSSVDDSVLNCSSDKTVKDREWFYNTAVMSMKYSSETAATVMSKYDSGSDSDTETKEMLESIQKHMKEKPISYDVFHLTDGKLASCVIDRFGVDPEDISDPVLDTYAKSLASHYIKSSDDISLMAANALFTELCTSAMYAAELTGTDKGTYYVVIKWQGGYTTVTVLRDTGRGAAVPDSHFLNDEDTVNDFIEMLNSYGSVLN